MADIQNPLESLYGDSNAIDLSRLANLLKPFVIIDRISKKLNFLESFEKLSSNTEKIEIILVASKATNVLEKTPEGFTTGEIISFNIMPEGSVKSSIKKLYDGRKILKNTDGKYVLPNYRLGEIIEAHK